MYRDYRDRAAFLFVYIYEAHPSDAWQMPVNEKDGVVFRQPGTLAARQDVAAQCCTAMKLSMPCVVDQIDNRVDEAYAAWPERFFIIGADGRIAYAGRPGPWGFRPDEVEAWLRKNARRPAS